MGAEIKSIQKDIIHLEAISDLNLLKDDKKMQIFPSKYKSNDRSDWDKLIVDFLIKIFKNEENQNHIAK